MWTVIVPLLKTRLASTIAAAATAALLAGAFVHIRESRAHAADIQHLESQHDLQMANINAAASAQQLENDARYQDAQNAAKTREISLRNDAASARAAADSMRITTNKLRSENAELSREAISLRAATSYKLLEQCAGRYQGLAERADRHVNDIRTLIDGWPR